ncbi:MAG: hypothetical protein E6G41_04015 [Actinobacteria bacterium]|nr:MAG: hypothetical protein E6G41_04015 [Actinomycetota bacterium]
MADGDREVLSSLPRTRPERRSAKRGARTPAAAARAAPTPKKTARPKPKAAAPREVPPSGYAVPRTRSPVNPGGTELVGTAIQALGELANLGSRAVRGALSRLPRA